MDIQDFNSKNRNKMVDRVVQKKIDSLTESYLNGTIELDESATALGGVSIASVIASAISVFAKLGLSEITISEIRRMADSQRLKGIKNYNINNSTSEKKEEVTLQRALKTIEFRGTNDDRKTAIKICRTLKANIHTDGRKVTEITNPELVDTACAELLNIYSEYEDLPVGNKKLSDPKLGKVIHHDNILESRLPEDGSDPQYGVPEVKKYPLFDEAHVRSAIKLFGHVEPKYEQELARAIIVKMKKYGISYDVVGKENKLYKYIPQKMLAEAVKIDEKIYEDVTLYESGIIRFVSDTSSKTLVEDMRRCEKLFNESVIDPVHDTLCQDLFKGEEIREDIIDYIRNALDEWKEVVKLKAPIKSITCSGSLLTYQYNPTTDLDIHVYIDGTDEDIDNAWKVMPKGAFIPNTNHPLEYTFMKSKGDEDDKNAENLYDIQNKKWIKRTSKEKMGSQIPTDYITRISKFYMMAIDAAIGQADVHKRELANLKSMEIESNFSEEDKLKAIKEKCNDLIEDRDGLVFIVKLLRSFRTVAYDNMDKASKLDDLLGASFEIKLPNDPHYSLNEMIFKTIERYGYKSKVDEYVKELTDIIEKEEKPLNNSGHETIDRSK